MKQSIIKFLIASAIFIVVAFIGVLVDAILMTTTGTDSMPNLFYYTFGWIGSGLYVLFTLPKNGGTN